MPRAAARITVPFKRPSRRGRVGSVEATNILLPRRASTYPLPFEILDCARHGVRIDVEKAGALPDARQRLIARDAATLDDVLQLLRQLPADRDRAVRVCVQGASEFHTVLLR
jgi:hypothetical protein